METVTLPKVTKAQEARVPEIAAKWERIARLTDAMTNDDRAACVDAVHQMYRVAGYDPPSNIVFVPSAYVLRLAAGPAKQICDDFGKGAAKELPRGHWEDSDIVWQAIRAATDPAGGVFVINPVRDFVPEEGDGCDYDKWWRYERCQRAANGGWWTDYHQRASEESWALWTGGNIWSGRCAFRDFFKVVCGFDNEILDKFWPWDVLAMRSGPRCVSRTFCMISDRPSVYSVDEAGRPHAEHGPYAKWRDGGELYRWHGIELPARAIVDPGSIRVADVRDEPNMERKRALAELMGYDKYLFEVGATVLDADFSPVERGGKRMIPRYLMSDKSGLKVLMGTDGSTKRVYMMSVPAHVKTCREAHESICGLSEDKMISQG